MFIGRTEELNLLERLYTSPKFEFLILFGRRRIGKTCLLQEFSKKHHCFFFSAMQKNDAMNLSDFSKLIQLYFETSFMAPFADWAQAFAYIGNKSKNGRTVIIIDEFPFLAEENPAIKSILQHQIDKDWNNRNILLVLCGSNISFMENEVMRERSPLYGRSTAQLEVKQFDYREAGLFFPAYSAKDKLTAYGILGGVPRYLAEFDGSIPLRENIQNKILDTGAFLKEEPQALLRMEVREANIYNSILQTVAGGVNRISEIAAAIHEEQSKVSKYIVTLQNIRLLAKIVPCGESPESKKGIYRITDNFLTFWYRYEFTNQNYYDLIGKKAASEEIMKTINDYMGFIYEDICAHYLIRSAKARALPFIPYYLGKWWRNNPAIKEQDDIDILALSKDKKSGLFGECKFTNRKFDAQDLNDVLDSMKPFPMVKEQYIFIFSKNGWTASAEKAASQYRTTLVTAEDLFK